MPVETHKMIFRVCPACSELEPSLILGELEAGVKRQGEEKKGVCAWYCLSRAFCFVMLGVLGGLALQVIKSFLYHRDPPSHQDMRCLGE